MAAAADIGGKLSVKGGRETRNVFDSVAQGALDLGKKVADLSGGFLSVGKWLNLTIDVFQLAKDALNAIKDAILAVGRALAGIVISGAETAGMFQDIRVRLDTAFGQGSSAEAAIKWVRKFAIETPLMLQDVENRAVRLKLAGLDPLDEGRKYMQKLGDAAFAVGTNFDSLLLPLRKLRAGGNATTREINSLARLGVLTYGEMSEAIGVTTKQLKNLGKQGIDGRDIVDKLIDVIGVKFAGSMDRGSRTLAGVQSSLAGIKQEIELAFFKEPVEAFTGELVRLRDAGIALVADPRFKAFAGMFSTYFTDMVKEFGEVVDLLIKIDPLNLKTIADFLAYRQSWQDFWKELRTGQDQAVAAFNLQVNNEAWAKEIEQAVAAKRAYKEAADEQARLELKPGGIADLDKEAEFAEKWGQAADEFRERAEQVEKYGPLAVIGQRQSPEEKAYAKWEKDQQDRRDKNEKGMLAARKKYEDEFRKHQEKLQKDRARELKKAAKDEERLAERVHKHNLGLQKDALKEELNAFEKAMQAKKANLEFRAGLDKDYYDHKNRLVDISYKFERDRSATAFKRIQEDQLTGLGQTRDEYNSLLKEVLDPTRFRSDIGLDKLKFDTSEFGKKARQKNLNIWSLNPRERTKVKRLWDEILQKRRRDQEDERKKRERDQKIADEKRRAKLQREEKLRDENIKRLIEALTSTDKFKARIEHQIKVIDQIEFINNWHRETLRIAGVKARLEGTEIAAP